MHSTRGLRGSQRATAIKKQLMKQLAAHIVGFFNLQVFLSIGDLKNTELLFQGQSTCVKPDDYYVDVEEGICVYAMC